MTQVPRRSRSLWKLNSVGFSSAAERVNPSVVPILAEQTQEIANPTASWNDSFRQCFRDDFFNRFFRAAQGETKQKVRSLGSGVIMSADGYILTNNHVVDGGGKLWVTLANNERFSASVVGRDLQTNFAVIQIDSHDFQAAPLGGSGSLHVGHGSSP